MDEKTAQEFVANREKILAKGDRAEIIPIKGGIRLARMRRETVMVIKND